MRVFYCSFLALFLGGGVALAGPGNSDGAKDAATMESASAEAMRLRETLQKRARKGAWGGVEQAYEKLLALRVSLKASDHMAGAEAARHEGDSWRSYQRLVMTIQIDEETPDALDHMRTLRGAYGRLTVRRVEATAIAFEKLDAPFTPDERSSVNFAMEALKQTGGFDGLLPLGHYRIGANDVEVVKGLKPVVVQRTVGDGG